jgi:hypothetical protein
LNQNFSTAGSPRSPECPQALELQTDHLILVGSGVADTS